jgi:hypothetical protein
MRPSTPRKFWVSSFYRFPWECKERYAFAHAIVSCRRVSQEGTQVSSGSTAPVVFEAKQVASERWNDSRLAKVIVTARLPSLSRYVAVMRTVHWSSELGSVPGSFTTAMLRPDRDFHEQFLYPPCQMQTLPPVGAFGKLAETRRRFAIDLRYVA